MSTSLFKPRKKQFRQRRRSSDEEENEETTVVSSILEEAKEVQKCRQRQKGVTAEDLLHGKQEQKKEKNAPAQQVGGYVDIKALKQASVDDDISQIGTTFAAETNRRDEDADMLKYVEVQLAKKKGISKDGEEDASKKESSAEDALFQLPEHLKVLSGRKRTEDMLSNQMLSGIPEVDLGIHAKIRNIEQTEEAKQKLLQERMSKKDTGVSAFVPTNMAVNFVQHNRFNIEDSAPVVKKEEPKPKYEPLRVGDVKQPQALEEPVQPKKGEKREKGEKATDDFHYEKFKKQLRRY